MNDANSTLSRRAGNSVRQNGAIHAVDLANPGDLTLEVYRRVAWERAGVRLAPAAQARMAETRAGFEALLENQPDLFIYGVTSGYGHRAKQRLSAAERAAQAARPGYPAMAAFGEVCPDRVARGIVLARLGTLVSGHAAVRPELADAVAAMLAGGPMPAVPLDGQQSPGEILATSALFSGLAARFGTKEKEMLALLNGAPVAAALIADAALAARRRIDLAFEVAALAADAIGVPHEHFHPVFEQHWGDPHETEALVRLRALLDGGADRRRAYQAPVSARILPRMLGRLLRVTAAAETAAQTSLQAVTDNPIYLPSAECDDPADHPWGRVLSNGGFHNAIAWPALDDLAAAWADQCQIAERQTMGLLDPRIADLPDQRDLQDDKPYLGCFGFAHAGFAEQARHHAQRTFLPASAAGGFGQNDVAVPTARAWDKERKAARCLVSALAMTAVAAVATARRQRQQAPQALQELTKLIERHFDFEGEEGGYTEALLGLTDAFERRIYEDPS